MFLKEMFDVFVETVMVSFLVIMMMMIIEYIQIKTKDKWDSFFMKKKWIQVFLAAAIGLIPGCIGGFTVVSLFSHGIVSYGALLAALITTFGDEAFFLYSLMPDKAIILSISLFVVGILVGFITNKIPYFNKKNLLNINHITKHGDVCTVHNHDITENRRNQRWKRYLLLVFILLFILSIFTKISDHEHIEMFHPIKTHEIENIHTHDENNHLFFINKISVEKILFLSVSIISLIIIISVNLHFVQEHLWNHVIKKHFFKVFLWTFFILLFLHIGMQYISLEEIGDNSTGKIFILILAILIGIIPQSGPHLLFIFLFIDGLIPFSVLLANSIVQEGHSGLPLIAESRKYFISIKIIKIILAIIIGLIGLWLGY